MGWKARPQEALETSRTNFINVDLDLNGSFDLAPLLAALGPVHIIHTPDESASFYILELDAVGLDFEATLGGFLDLIEQLDGAARRLWERCSLRKFNIGIQAGLDPSSTLYSISGPMALRVATAGVDVVISVSSLRESST